MYKKLSIIIPAYNEEATVAVVIDKVLAVPLPQSLKKEIIIVNDGSRDRTAEVLMPFLSREGIAVLSQGNAGKTAAILAGLKNATGDIFLVQDADLEYDPSHYPQLLGPILAGEAEVVYGSRFLGTIDGMAVVNRLANWVSNRSFSWLYGTRITDINTCFKVFTRAAFEGITITSKNFAFETEVTVKFLRKGLVLKEVPVSYQARSRQAGKKIRWSTALEMFWPIIKYRFIRG